jgi:hypothetical protein
MATMKALELIRPLAGLGLLVLAPALASAQSRGVGVVTTLSGHATVARPTLPQPQPLRFKDDVFERDRIRTGEKSIVRVLMGGKALITVRELSELTITEAPGRSTVNLVSGKVALGVVKDRMRPGESIEVRTPNAIAAVRGTVFAVEIIRASASSHGGPVPVRTNVYVMRGRVAVSDPNNPAAPPTEVTDNQAWGRTGEGPGTVRDVPPAEMKQVLADPRTGPQITSGPEGFMSAMEAREQERAVLLASTLVSEGGAGGRGNGRSRLVSEGGAGGRGNGRSRNDGGAGHDGPSGNAEAPINPATAVTGSGGSGSGSAGAATKSSGSGSAGAATKSGNALTTYSGQTVNTSGSFYSLGGNVRAALAQPLLETTTSALTLGASFVDLSGNSGLAATDAVNPFISLDPTTAAAASLLTMGGHSTFSAAATFLKDLGGTLTATRNGVDLGGHSTFTVTGTSASLLLDGTTASVGRSLLDAGGGAQATMAGGLLEAVNNATVTVRRAVTLSGNATLVSATAPLIQLLGGSSLTTALDLVSVSSNAAVTTLSLATVDAASLRVANGAGLALSGNAQATIRGDAFTLRNGATLSLAGAAAPFTLSGNASLLITGAIFNFGAGGGAVTVTNSLCGAACTLINGIPVLLAGGARGNQISITNPIKNPAGGTVTYSSPAAALISISGNATLTVQGQ